MKAPRGINRNCVLWALWLWVALGADGKAWAASEVWPKLDHENKPWCYWWWMGSAVDRDNITWQLEAYARAGLGGVHIIPIYGARGYEDRFIDYLSPQWMAMLDHTVREANRLDMGVDMTLGTGWCFGGPGVTGRQANAALESKIHTLAGGQPLPPLANRATQAAVAYGPDGRTIELTDRIDAEGKLAWTAPAGEWKVYEVWQQPSGQRVKRAAPGGQGHMLNPFYGQALADFLQWFEPAFDAYQGALPRAIYHDSYEYNGNWSPDFFDEFERRRGYRLQRHLPELLGDGDTGTARRVKADYRRTIDDLLVDNFIRPWAGWVHQRGMITRNEAHGSPGNLLDLYGETDMPETEFFRFDRNPLIAKFASSAAHVMDRGRVGSETATWLAEHFQVTLNHLKNFIDGLFIGGVNHMFYHGTCYSPADAPWPGWVFYASTQMNPRNTLWRDAGALNGYLARCQSVLRAGRPDNDLLIYWPIDDFWHEPGGLNQNLTVHHTEWFTGQPIGPLSKGLWEKGYDFDYISERQLQLARATEGGIELPGGRYRAIIVPASRYLPLAVMQQLLALARTGARVIFEKELPGDVPGLGDLDQRRAQLQALLKPLIWQPAGGGSAQVCRLGQGGLWRGDAVESILTEMGIGRETLVDQPGLRFIRRVDDQGHWYFITNQDAQFTHEPATPPLAGWLTLTRPARSVTLLDPLTGQTGAATWRTLDGQTQVYLQLNPGQSLILRLWNQKQTETAPWVWWQPAGQPHPITGTWRVDFIEGGPVLPPSHQTQTLTSWTEFGIEGVQAFAGTARYRLEFDHPGGTTANWMLDLGRVCQSARVCLNGQSLGTLFNTPCQIPTGAALRPGRNTLQIEVTSLAANRIRYMDQQKITWRTFYDINVVNIDYKPFDASAWPLMDCGLFGPVRLIPLQPVAD